jgi:phosphate transport system substrate-binding protein
MFFLGEITSWNDSLIADCNPGANLPNLHITVVRRAEGSGTTYAFTNHLISVGKSVGTSWKEEKANKTWPITQMIGARGNPGVAALIKQTPGAIGYLEYGYAELAELPTAVLENKKGKYVRATPDSSQAAIKGVKLPKDFRPWIPDPAGPDAYPIVTYTWLLCYKDYSFNPVKGKALLDVIKFCLTDGQKFSKELGYIPLPKDIAQEVLAAVEQIKT